MTNSTILFHEGNKIQYHHKKLSGNSIVRSMVVRDDDVYGGLPRFYPERFRVNDDM